MVVIEILYSVEYSHGGSITKFLDTTLEKAQQLVSTLPQGEDGVAFEYRVYKLDEFIKKNMLPQPIKGKWFDDLAEETPS